MPQEFFSQIDANQLHANWTKQRIELEKLMQLSISDFKDQMYQTALEIFHYLHDFHRNIDGSLCAITTVRFTHGVQIYLDASVFISNLSEIEQIAYRSTKYHMTKNDESAQNISEMNFYKFKNIMSEVDAAWVCIQGKDSAHLFGIVRKNDEYAIWDPWPDEIIEEREPVPYLGFGDIKYIYGRFLRHELRYDIDDPYDKVTIYTFKSN